jgi:heme/copper-type cytochrome/quinol oxidase subunit 2
MKKQYAISLIVFLMLVTAVVYLQFMKGDVSENAIVGNVVASPAESATTFTGLLIVFVLVWYTFGKEEQVA